MAYYNVQKVAVVRSNQTPSFEQIFNLPYGCLPGDFMVATLFGDEDTPLQQIDGWTTLMTETSGSSRLTVMTKTLQQHDPAAQWFGATDEEVGGFVGTLHVWRGLDSEEPVHSSSITYHGYVSEPHDLEPVSPSIERVCKMMYVRLVEKELPGYTTIDFHSLNNNAIWSGFEKSGFSRVMVITDRDVLTDDPGGLPPETTNSVDEEYNICASVALSAHLFEEDPEEPGDPEDDCKEISIRIRVKDICGIDVGLTDC